MSAYFHGNAPLPLYTGGGGVCSGLDELSVMLESGSLTLGVDSVLMGVIVGGWTTAADENSGVAEREMESRASWSRVRGSETTAPSAS